MTNLLRIACLLSFLCLDASAQTKEFPPVPLRGYGTLAGTYRDFTLPGGPASILEIRCDDAAKAQTVHAKYISDLQVLPGVGPVAATKDALPAYQIAQRNFIAA